MCHHIIKGLQTEQEMLTTFDFVPEDAAHQSQDSFG
jgi:hypothetical protein